MTLLSVLASARGFAHRRLAACLLVGVCCGSLAGCTSWPRAWGREPCRVQAKPAVRRQAIGWHLFDVTVIEPFKRGLHVGRLTRRLLGVPVRALNLRDGEVAESAFFADRDPARLSPEEVRWGPTHPEDLLAAPVTITKPKVEGKTAGFFVTDARQRRYLLKLDPVEAPELLSGAEVVGSKLLHALGYRVPSYEIAYLAPGDVRIAPGAQVREAEGHLAPFTEERLHALMTPRLQEGRMRVSSTKILEGDILGPARFKRFRDCADVRALRLAFAWINDIDTKDHNSLLVWNGRETQGYLIDFGTSLGADAGRGGPKQPCAGWTYIVDMKEASLEMLTLGLYQPACASPAPPYDRSVGFFSGDFDPARWKPYAPNAAFHEMDQQDARWMARRMSRVTSAHLEAAVAAGQYSNPADAAYLADVLEARRDAIVRRYLEEAR